MKSNLPKTKHHSKTNKLINRDLRLKKIVSIVIFLNKKFEEKYSVSIHKVHFANERLLVLSIHHQKDILNVLNSFLISEGYKPTTLRTLREDLRFLIRIKALKKRILTFSNNMNQFKGKLCIYDTSSISYSLVDTYFKNYKFDLFKEIKANKDELKTQNVTENVTVYINSNNNINNKNSSEIHFKKINKEHSPETKKIISLEKKLNLDKKRLKQIKKISLETKNSEKTYKNSLLNYKDFKNYLKEDYEIRDIEKFYLKKLKKYKNKIHFMRQYAKYETDFYPLAGEFKDTYTSKWKQIKNEISNSYLANFKRKKI